MANVYYLHTPMAKADDTLPNRIRYWRKLRGMSQEDLGDRIGKSKQQVGHLESGLRPLTDAYRFAIARALDVDPADLFLPEQSQFTVPEGERAFWQDYVALDARGRQLLREQARTYREWQTEPEEEAQPKRA